MLNPKLKLNPKIFNDAGENACEQVPIRKGFGQGLALAGEQNENVVALCADLTESTQMNFFKEKFPERFVEIGVAEQNLVTVASGMAAMGKIPFCSSYAMFSPGRNWEQIRTTIAYNDRKVVIVGSHAGISVGPDGGTHQALEDIGLMRLIPNMDVVSPCDAIEAKKATLSLAKTKTPAYLRLAREKTPIITTDETPFNIGKAEIYWIPDIGIADVGIVVTGGLMHRALLAAKELETEGVKTKVMNISSIKPIDTEALIILAKETKCIVTVEEHQVMGGVGSAIAEVLVQNFPVPIEFVGVKDKFGQSGTPDELVEHYGMGKSSIKEAVKKVLKRKMQHNKMELSSNSLENANHILAHDVKCVVGKNRDMFAEMLAGSFGEITDQGKSIIKRLMVDTADLITSVINILKARDQIIPNLKPFDFKEAVLDSIAFIKDKADEGKIKIEISINKKEDYTVNADRYLIVTHVLKNLIENAVIFNIKNGSISIDLSKKDPKTVFLVIKNTGWGMTEEDQKNLFTPGGHGVDAVKKNIHTSGFGLFIAKQAMDAHKGKIYGTSEGRDKGATFFVELSE